MRDGRFGALVFELGRLRNKYIPGYFNVFSSTGNERCHPESMVELSEPRHLHEY